MKNFLILTDLDSTFEEYQSGRNEFALFETFLNNFEKKFNVEVKIHFISGTNKEDLAKRFMFFKTLYPRVFERIDYAIISRGVKFNTTMQKIGVCETDKAVYDKSDAVQHIIKDYGRFLLAGVCYMGDDITDIDAFETTKLFGSRLPLGAYALAPRSRRAFDQIKGHINFYSDKPRILGCVENLKKMEKAIQYKANQSSRSF